jgi:hypothetical protein
MAQSGKGRLNYRCPSCFMRDLDIDMFYDKEKDEFYCIRCQYTGNEKDVLEKTKWLAFVTAICASGTNSMILRSLTIRIIAANLHRLAAITVI